MSTCTRRSRPLIWLAATGLLLHAAMASARETGACIDVALALGYVESVDAGLLDALDKVRATLVRVLQ